MFVMTIKNIIFASQYCVAFAFYLRSRTSVYAPLINPQAPCLARNCKVFIHLTQGGGQTGSRNNVSRYAF